MEARHSPRRRWLTIIAQDPSCPAVNGKKGILKAKVPVPYEEMGAGPCGYRVQLVDYDASSDTLLKPWEPLKESDDPFEGATDKELLSNPRFHQQNVYAIVMRTLARFELALGRRVSWSFGGHQLKIAPHAFRDANAFYSKNDEALYFGYFTGMDGKKTIFSCLSHDVIAHETTHALLDGLRGRYTDPSSPDQAAFHEGFSDVVALLSVFSVKEVVEALVRKGKKGSTRIPASWMTVDNLKKDILFSLADEMGQEMSQVRGQPLRRSTELTPRPGILDEEEFLEEHRRGEVLVAAVLGAMIEVWAERVKGLAKFSGNSLDLERVVEEGRLIADRLLTMSIRALDYCPTVHLEFSDYLSALLTADREVYPDDSLYRFRNRLSASFAAYGILPASKAQGEEPGVWGEPESKGIGEIIYDRTHFESMQRDPDEVFKFIWENRKKLELVEGAYTRVLSVRPCVRMGEDGFMLRETVAEYVQILRLRPEELESFGYKDPGREIMPEDREVFLYGGGVLIFDEYGRLKFHIHNRLDNYGRQNKRIQHLAEAGYYERLSPMRKRGARLSAFGLMHLTRSFGGKKSGEGCGCHTDVVPAKHTHGKEHDDEEDENENETL